MKKNLVLILCGILILSLTGCNNKNDVEINDEEVISTFEKETQKTWQEDAETYDITVFMNKYWYVYNYHITDLYNVIKKEMVNDEYKNNVFFKKYIEEYEKINVDDLTEKEIEFLSSFVALICNEYFDYNNYNITNIWSYNYENDGSINDKIRENLNNSERGFFLKLNTKGNERVAKFKIKYTYNSYTNPKEYFRDTQALLYISEESFDKYTFEDNEYYINLIEKNKSFFDFVYEYHKINRRYNERINAEDKAEQEAKAKPRPGMTATEVLSTDWGYPDKKNVDTYSWGTREQWVYDDRGYVYFENGIVTSVSER